MIGEVGGKREHNSSFPLREHLAALDLEHYAWAPLLHHREGNLWRCIPIYNAQSECIQFIYVIFTVYIQPMQVSSMLGSVWMAPSAWRFEAPAACCFSTSEVLSCSGVLSMTPQQVHCWLWCWTWHPSGIGPLFGKSTSHLTCITWT